MRKTIVDKRGRIHRFPGIIRKNFWVRLMINPGDLMPRIKNRTDFERKGDKWLVLWEVQPDGRYWAEGGGFGMEDDEIVLCTYLDMNGNFTGPFRAYSVGIKECFTEENK